MTPFTNPPARATSVLDPTLAPTAMSLWWYGWFTKLSDKLNSLFTNTYSGTVPLAKLTTGGTAGSITFVNGIATSVVSPT